MPLAYFLPDLIPRRTERLTTDLCIYGGSSAGVIAAVQAARQGMRVVVLDPSEHVGGLTASGLGETDFGRKAAIGGLSREFYRCVGGEYGKTEEEWKFEPHVAEKVFRSLLAEHGIQVVHRQFLRSVTRHGARIHSVAMHGGLTVVATVFIDATYEGDLMARAGCRYAVGREANSLYGETLNGVQVHPNHQFDRPVDPYRVPGVPSSGVLPGIDPSPLAPIGSGDSRVQAYNFRMCLTDDPANRRPFPRPDDYDPLRYELLARHLDAGWREVFRKFDRLCVRAKTDTNNHGAQSTDFVGGNHAWPEASYQERERIFQAHVSYQQGYHWFLSHDTRVPAEVRADYAKWGLAADEFADTGGWPHQLYVREARRLISDYVITENDCRGHRVAEDPIGLGSYNMDSHNCRRFIRDGFVSNEGDVQVPPTAPYGVSYRAIVPSRGQCANLLVPVCCACSHIAYGSLRMEPVFMVLAQSAAIAAGIAADRHLDVQDVPYQELRQRMLAAGQVLGWKISSITEGS